jgi:hypothetical protein
MKLLDLIETMRRGLKGVILACCAALAVLLAADGLVRLAHRGPEVVDAAADGHPAGFWAAAHHAAEGVPAFWAGFGVLGCVALIAVSKAVVGPMVHKREDYYDE